MTPLSPEIQAELAKLRDIRLPDPVGWWPLAPGWWALIALVLLAVLAFLTFESRRRRTVRHAALRELSGLKARLDGKAAASEVAAELAVLLRRVVLSGPEAPAFASVSGSAWVAALGRGPGGLSEPVAVLLANAPYAPSDPPLPAEDLRGAVAEVETWIRRHT